MALKITTKYMIKNDCFLKGDPLRPSGIMIHSTATPGIMADDWFSIWNKSFAHGQMDREVAVHAFVDDKGVFQYLPWTMRGWHAGGAANNDCIGIETCEPAGIEYAVGSFNLIAYDPKKFASYFNKVWQMIYSFRFNCVAAFKLTRQKLLAIVKVFCLASRLITKIRSIGGNITEKQWMIFVNKLKLY
ncbi:peptidoglycan recognition protein family protein [Oenococcus oeni]|uniref:peptidoglycan recognition protein family protein n=1 Tax=Oenococcus oeni TaxID=1247 RepID=UPI000B2FFB1F|nr:peptidoglycan recognition family protein [Oenococcus oeni]